jgi:hypothetical protein
MMNLYLFKPWSSKKHRVCFNSIFHLQLVTKILYTQLARSIFKFQINYMGWTFHWSTMHTTNEVGWGFFNLSFFLKLSKVMFTPNPPSSNTFLTSNLLIQTWITSIASSKSLAFIVLTLYTPIISIFFHHHKKLLLHFH